MEIQELLAKQFGEPKVELCRNFVLSRAFFAFRCCTSSAGMDIMLCVVGGIMTSVACLELVPWA